MAAKPGRVSIGSAADGLVIEFGHQLVAGVFRERLDGLALTLVAVLVGADVRGRAQRR
jgi:hypothetical protein